MGVHDPIAEVFIDESSQNGHRYLVLGGIIVPLAHTEEFTAAVVKARLPELPEGEMKWAKVSNSKLAAYTRVVDAFFAPALRDTVHYHSLYVDMTKHDNRRFNDGNREIGFNKEVFQLAYKFTRLYAARLHV